MLYTAPPDPAKLALWGLTPADFDDAPMEVWPENWQAVQFFAAIGAGAWSIGPGGPVGIRPEAFREVRLGLGITAQQWRVMFGDIAAMEAEALRVMKEQTK